jgi:NlpC/P60 family putative phage cell wall peptidase
MTTPDDIIRAARGRIGTPFHHQARIKGVGVDCIGLLVGIAAELELTDDKGIQLADYDKPNYSPLPDGRGLKAAVSVHLLELPSIGEALPGDVYLFRFQHDPQHVGILSELPDGAPAIIHCYSNTGKVVEHRLNDTWRKLIVAAYRFPNLQLATV